MTGVNPASRSLRNVALPIEHGGWAFLFEPILLGLLVTPSLPGILFGLAGLGIFLLFRPVQVALKDWLKRKRFPRTAWAERFIILYAIPAAGGAILAVLSALGPFWYALLLAIPFAGLQMLLVVRGRARDAITEVSGAVALAAMAPAIVLAGGGTITLALALWLVPVTRAIASIIYIRARLRRARGDAYSRAIPIALHGAGALVLALAWVASVLPITAPLAMVILAIRAWHGLTRARTDIPAKNVGVQEIGFGVLTVILIVMGVRLS